MAESCGIVTADIGGLIWTAIVLAVVISRIIKASKRGSQAGPGIAPRAESSAVNPPPQNELQEFLESLARSAESGQAQAPARPAPHPTQAAAGPMRTALQAAPRQTAQAGRRQPPPVPRAQTQVRQHPMTWDDRARPAAPVALPAEPAPRPLPQARRQAAVAVKAHEPPGRTGRFRSARIEDLRIALGMDLITPVSLRKAVLLREVLGPPLAMRRPDSDISESSAR